MAETPSPGGNGPFGFLSRRRFLKLGLMGGGTLLAIGGGGVGGLLALRGRAPKVAGLRILSSHEYRTLTNLARTHLPRGGAFDQGGEDAELARAFDDFLADEPPENIRDLKLALTLIEFGPVVFGGSLSTFSNLDDGARLEHWKGWIVSPRLLQRQAATAFRKFMSLVFYDRPAVWPHIHYPGPVMGSHE